MLSIRPNPFSHASSYSGQRDIFGRRHGLGSENWKNQGQRYEGKFFRDSYHGEGEYVWSSHAIFEGPFYANVKEGYGLVSMPDGSTFEGLFRNDRAFGPGVQTQANGRQDVGFWCGRRIVRLSRPVDFIVPRLASTDAGKLKLLRFQKLIPFVEENANLASTLIDKYEIDPEDCPRLYSSFVYDQRSLFFNRITFDKAFFEAVGSDSDDKSIVAEDETFFGEKSERVSEGEETQMGPLRYYSMNNSFDGLLPELFPKKAVSCDEPLPTEVTHITSWNRTDFCVEMLQQIYRFRSFEDKISFKISDIIAGARCKFRMAGDMERACIEFLRLCSVGPVDIVKTSLYSHDISESLMDSRGNNSIMFAAAADQHEVIDLLADNGADVNAFNDENLTPLNLCLLRRLALTYRLGNWEVCFLSAEDHSRNEKSFHGGNRRSSASELNTWKSNQSTENLDDRITTVRSCLADSSGSEYEGESPLEGDITFFGGHGKNLKREEYLKSVAIPTADDKYLFETNRAPEEIDREKAQRIDRTIELLLMRGADPNLSDVPRPSLHLALLTRDVALVRLLLIHGASPDSPILPEDGLLTPLHVLSQMTPGRDLVEICKLLLNYGASPEEETTPGFDADGQILTETERGRTALELLCMRKDNSDPDGFLSDMATLLGSVSMKTRFFNSQSSTTLAMACGNGKLRNDLLCSEGTNPNQVSGNDPLTKLRTSYDEPFGQMPTATFKSQPSHNGAFVDNGYRKIEQEKSIREALGNNSNRDHPPNHAKVVEYLDEKSRKETKTSLKQRDDEKRTATENHPERKELQNRRKVSNDDRKIIEIKKHVAKIGTKRTETQIKAKGQKMKGSSEESGEVKKLGKEVQRTSEEKSKNLKTTATERERGEMLSGGNEVRPLSNLERLPQGFRRSLIHLFGNCEKRINVNKLVLPYVVLRNGDLYYRFKGEKPAQLEQYSLI